MRKFAVSRLAGGFIVAAMAALGAAAALSCGSAFSGSIINVGNTPNIPPQTSFNMLGTTGTPFFATISDTNSSWNVQGTVPMTIVLINNAVPVRMVANKLTAGPTLLSAQVLAGGEVIQLSSTVAPYGFVTVQLGGSLAGFARLADPDVRFFVKAPPGEVINGIIEDLQNSYLVQQAAPVLYLFENPDRRVDGQFNQVTDLGPMVIDLQYGHPPGPSPVVLSMTGGPHLVLKQP
jgi:hypothetical protein